MNPTPLQAAGAVILIAALAHAFASAGLQQLAERHPRHRGLLRLLGETGIVFGFWAFVLVGVIVVLEGPHAALAYAEGWNFTEPLFVFAVMIVAGSRPVAALAGRVVVLVCRGLPIARPLAIYFALSVLPLLGSPITEPGAMTLAAMVLRDRLAGPSEGDRLRHATLAVLIVNVSIGGLLTTYAAPPVPMVAGRWGRDTPYMLRHFAAPAALSVLVNATGATLLFRRELAAMAGSASAAAAGQPTVPPFAMAVGATLLAGIVAASHHPVIFIDVLLLFIGYSATYPHHHAPLSAREALLVASFLAGVVVLGGLQRWWLEPVLTAMSPTGVFYAAAGLTALPTTPPSPTSARRCRGSTRPSSARWSPARSPAAG